MKSLTALFLLFSACAFAQTESIFWKIEHPDIEKPSYLFGTYHLMNSGFLDVKAPKVLKAYQQADKVLVESKESDAPSDGLMQRYFFENPSISEAVGPANSKLIDSIMQLRINTPLSTFDKTKPVLLAVLIGLEYHNQYIADSGNYEGIPLDQYFDKEATANEVPVFSLEQPEESFGFLLDSISQSDQLKYLVLNCQYDSAMYRIAGVMFESYKQNDVPRLMEITNYYDGLVTDISSYYITEGRNRLWLPRLINHLETGNTFIAVGELHLTESYGLVSLLREQGYTLTPQSLE